ERAHTRKVIEKPGVRVRIVPGRVAWTGLADRSSSELRAIVEIALACMSPEMLTAARSRCAASAADSRWCCSNQPCCQYPLSFSNALFSAGGSAYHSPSLPALQPNGIDGTWIG